MVRSHIGNVVCRKALCVRVASSPPKGYFVPQIKSLDYNRGFLFFSTVCYLPAFFKIAAAGAGILPKESGPTLSR